MIIRFISLERPNVRRVNINTVLAHNIEDVARDAASFAIHEKELILLQHELTILIKNRALVEAHTKLLYVRKIDGYLLGSNQYHSSSISLNQIVESMIDWIIDPDNKFSPLEYEHYINSYVIFLIV